MNRVTANLRIYFQSAWMVVLWVIVALICLPLLFVPLFSPDRADERGFFFTSLLVSYFVGYFVAVLQKETLVKPFTFCLPGHRRLPRRIIFVIGAVISVLLGLTYLNYPGLLGERGWVAAGTAVWAATCLAMIFYLLATVLAWRLPGGGAWAVPVLFTWRIWADWQRELAERMGDHALVLTLGMGLGVLLVWFYLSPERQARQLCGTNFLAPHESLNRAKVEKYRLNQKSKQKSSPLLDGVLSVLVLPLIRRWSGSAALRYSGGEGLTAVSRLLTGTTQSLVLYGLLFLVLVLGLGYRPVTAQEEWITSANLIFLIPCIVGLAIVIPIFSPLLLPAGRRERMGAGMVVGLLGGLLSVGLGGVYHLISQVAAPLLPVLHVAGRDLAYEATDPRYIYLPLLILPLCYCCQLLFARWATIPQTILLIILACWMIFGASGLRPAGPWVIGAVLLVFWGTYFALVRHYCRNEDLVRK
jgi:hypothetical protein